MWCSRAGGCGAVVGGGSVDRHCVKPAAVDLPDGHIFREMYEYDVHSRIKDKEVHISRTHLLQHASKTLLSIIIILYVHAVVHLRMINQFLKLVYLLRK